MTPAREKGEEKRYKNYQEEGGKCYKMLLLKCEILCL